MYECPHCLNISRRNIMRDRIDRTNDPINYSVWWSGNRSVSEAHKASIEAMCECLRSNRCASGPLASLVKNLAKRRESLCDKGFGPVLGNCYSNWREIYFSKRVACLLSSSGDATCIEPEVNLIMNPTLIPWIELVIANLECEQLKSYVRWVHYEALDSEKKHWQYILDQLMEI